MSEAWRCLGASCPGCSACDPLRPFGAPPMKNVSPIGGVYREIDLPTKGEDVGLNHPAGVALALAVPATLDKLEKRWHSAAQPCDAALNAHGASCWILPGGHPQAQLEAEVALSGFYRELGYRMRNRVVILGWVEAERYRTLLWFTRSDTYTFNLDVIRIAQKYQAKRYFKGPKRGQLSCNPLGKNPGDVWPPGPCDMCAGRHADREMTLGARCHCMQTPIERAVLAFSNAGETVALPFANEDARAVVQRLERVALALDERGCAT